MGKNCESPHAEICPSKIYEIYRAYVEHEDELITSRTGALISVSSFLFATFGFLYGKKVDAVQSPNTECLKATLLTAKDVFVRFDSEKKPAIASITDFCRKITERTIDQTAQFQFWKSQDLSGLLQNLESYTFLIAVIGLLMGAITSVSVWAAMSAISNLKDKFKEVSGVHFDIQGNIKNRSTPAGVYKVFPMIVGGGKKFAWISGNIIALLPISITLAWLFVIILLPGLDWWYQLFQKLIF